MHSGQTGLFTWFSSGAGAVSPFLCGASSLLNLHLKEAGHQGQFFLRCTLNVPDLWAGSFHTKENLSYFWSSFLSLEAFLLSATSELFSLASFISGLTLQFFNWTSVICVYSKWTFHESFSSSYSWMCAAPPGLNRWENACKGAYIGLFLSVQTFLNSSVASRRVLWMRLQSLTIPNPNSEAQVAFMTWFESSLYYFLLQQLVDSSIIDQTILKFCHVLCFQLLKCEDLLLFPV